MKAIQEALIVIARSAEDVIKTVQEARMASEKTVNASTIITLSMALDNLEKVAKEKVRFITEKDLMDTFGSMQVIVIPTRYSLDPNCKYTAAFGSMSGCFPEMMDDLTGGDQCWANVMGLFNTPWYPYGQGATIQDAIETAIDRINTVDPKHKREALALVFNSSSAWKPNMSEPMKPLELTGEEY